MSQFTWDEFDAEVARRWFGPSAVLHPGTVEVTVNGEPVPETSGGTVPVIDGAAPAAPFEREIGRLRAQAEAGDRIIRNILEALCEQRGLSLESSVSPGEPARNYDLALRLGIGHVFGLKPQPAAEFAAAAIRLSDEAPGQGLCDLVRDMLEAFPDTADEQEWRDRAGELGVTDPDGAPYRAYTEEDL